MPLHANEVAVDASLVSTLLREQCPAWADLPLSPAGAGTDNVLYRLGDDLVVRLPRTPDHVAALRTEREWLPHLAPSLTPAIPEPVHAGRPTAAFPLTWSVYRWIDGDPVSSETVRDWGVFGTDLAIAVRELHGTALMGAARAGDLTGYRGGHLRDREPGTSRCLADCRPLIGGELDVTALEEMWHAALALPEPPTPHVWLHGDLKPSNLLVRAGRLHAVIDFGGLTVGRPDAEHAPVWDLPAEARRSYRDTLALDDASWARARAWAITVAASGIPYYWRTDPAFAAECTARLRAVLSDTVAG